jgi:formate hydrogenlyase subunit 4
VTVDAAAHIVLALALAPLLPGVINRTKAVFAGRTGQPLMQGYYDIARLLRKGAVYSTTTSWVFRAGPVISLAALLTAFTLLPFGESAAPLSFAGDFILLALLLAVGRLFMVLAALDTGSAFEGMGASREVTVAALAEPALLVTFAAMAQYTGALSLTAMFGTVAPGGWIAAAPVLLVAGAALFIVLLAENARIPVDDPNTHLELTMIHEVMILDHSGPDLGYITYASALKLWVLGALLLGVVLPLAGLGVWAGLAVMVAGMVTLAVVIGIIESTFARMRMAKLPVFVAAALGLSLFALMLAYR